MRGHTKKIKLGKTLYGGNDSDFRSASIYHSGGSMHTVWCEEGESHEKHPKTFRGSDARSKAKSFAEDFVNGNADLPSLSEYRKGEKKRKEKEHEKLNDTLESLGFEPLSE